MSEATYFYSLRMGIDPKTWDQRKTDELIKVVQAGEVDDVNLMLNCEELNVGHISVADLQPWLIKADEIKAALAPYGVSVSMNPWTTLLHSDRGRKLAKDQHFHTMVDYQGVKAAAVCCPADPSFVEYMAEIHAEYAKHDPKYLWMEDDFRHFNHKPLMFGCFCDYHMDLYNRELGTNYTQEELCAKIFQPGEPTQERLVYLKQARQEMITMGAAIAKAVRGESKDTQLALMTSPPEWHALEARDWDGLFDSLSIDQPHVSRPHLPCYNEISGLKYIREFNRNTRTVGHLMGEDAVMLPELENYMYSMYVKSKKFTQMQLETTALIGAKGILFNIYDMMGNGVVASYGLQDVMKESKPFLNYTVQNPLRIRHESGVKVLYSQDSVFTRVAKGSQLEDMLPREFEWLSLLATFGITTSLQQTKDVAELKDEIVAVSDQVLRNLTDGEITDLFTDNQVMLDGDSAAIMIERGLGDLIAAKDFTWQEPHTGLQTYEEWNGPELIEGVAHARMTVMQQTGAIANIDYHQEQVKRLTTLYNEYGENVGNGMAVVNDRHFVMPITFHPRNAWDAQYVNYKEKIIKGYLAGRQVDYLVDMPVVQMIREGNRLFITNFSLDPFETIKISLHDLTAATQLTANLINRQGQETVTLQRVMDYFELQRPLNAFETFIIEL